MCKNMRWFLDLNFSLKVFCRNLFTRFLEIGNPSYALKVYNRKLRSGQKSYYSFTRIIWLFYLYYVAVALFIFSLQENHAVSQIHMELMVTLAYYFLQLRWSWLRMLVSLKSDIMLSGVCWRKHFPDAPILKALG